ncbi:hypothetical protein FA13DRAFT_1825073 [Coprinellus micaceus]|uniref:Uncharacterized protein n=1 Tax=Coprinellus micaceus TaxID=71717 RepID=A0A4Y7R4S5_COPMI|nr:hypothetical protein FA13DRAFT_1825073 [Coprinellus micaceus]
MSCIKALLSPPLPPALIAHNNEHDAQDDEHGSNERITATVWGCRLMSLAGLSRLYWRISPALTILFTPSRPSTSSSFALSRTSTSDANSSFLECEESRSFKISPRKLRNTLFRNRNTHLNASRSEQDLELNSSQASFATGDTRSTTTDEAFSTESSDCIPYIPFVSQHERGIFPEPSSAPRARYTQRQAAPSPTPPARRPNPTLPTRLLTPLENVLFGGDSDSQPSITINSEDQEGDEVSITSSSVSYASTERDTFGLPVTSTESEESMVSFSDPFGTERARRAREIPRHPFATSPDSDDVFTEQRAPATGAGTDMYSIATSESCYSLDTYHDPADENYRFSRTSSQMNVQSDSSHPTDAHPGNRKSTATANSDGQLMLDDYTKMRFAAATGSHMSAPPDIRVESASTISHIPTPARKRLAISFILMLKISFAPRP